MAQASHLHGRIASSAIGALGANLLIFEGRGGGFSGEQDFSCLTACNIFFDTKH